MINTVEIKGLGEFCFNSRNNTNISFDCLIYNTGTNVYVIYQTDDSTVDGEFVDAETSPMKDTGDREDDLSIENRQAVLSEEDSFQDALEESINPEEGEEGLSEKQKIGEEVGSGDREIENKHDEQIIGEENAAEGAGLEHTVPAVEEKGVGVDDTIQENGKDVEIKEEVVSDTKEDGLEENLESNGEVIKTDDNEKQVDENQETVEQVEEKPSDSANGSVKGFEKEEGRESEEGPATSEDIVT